MAMSDEEAKKLRETFQKMGIKPKMGSPEQLEEWMQSYLTSKGKKPATTTYQPQFPRLSTFFGDDNSKGDTSFDLWKFEVQCLKSSALHPLATVCQAVRKSVKGEAARIVKRLGPEATVDQMMKKLEDVYGEVDAGETLLAEFYAARQAKTEDVTAWGCRLEDLLDRARERHPIPEPDINEMLRSKFWN